MTDHAHRWQLGPVEGTRIPATCICGATRDYPAEEKDARKWKRWFEQPGMAKR